MKTIVHIGTLVLSLVALTTAPAATVLTFGGPGYVSQGLTYTYTVGATGSGSGWSSHNGLVVTFSFLDINGKSAQISFSGPSIQTTLSVGEYTGVENYLGTPLYDTAGFSLTNQGKTSLPIVDGWFKIFEIKLNPPEFGYAPLKVAADFFVRDANGDYTAGSFRWGSNIPATPINQIIPEAPSSFLLIGTIGLMACRRRRT